MEPEIRKSKIEKENDPPCTPRSIETSLSSLGKGCSTGEGLTSRRSASKLQFFTQVDVLIMAARVCQLRFGVAGAAVKALEMPVRGGNKK